jgi:hypothetical protein
VQKVQGNWPIPFYFTGLILLAGHWAAEYSQKWLRKGLVIGYLMIAITYPLPILISVFNLHNTPVDPTYRFRHWHELAANIDTIRHQTSAENAEQSFVIALGHRYLASQLAFYLPDHPQVFRYEASGLVTSQYEVWPGPQAYLGKTGFIVSEQNEAAIPAELKSAFQSFKEVASIPNPMNKDARYYLYIGENLNQWPPKANKE